MDDRKGLTLDPSDPIWKLITDIPDFATNPVGTVTRKALVSKLKGSIPGKYNHHFGLPAPPQRDLPFLSIFFPSHSQVPYDQDVAAYTGLVDGWWTDFSVAALCQSIYWQTNHVRSNLWMEKVDQDVNDYNQTLKQKAIRFYSHVLFSDFIKYSGDPSNAKTIYIDQICSSTWVTLKMKQYTDGAWTNPSWEEFHHWTKLSALEATDDEIASVIDRLRNLGLRIFPDVDISTWQSYFVWYSPDKIDHLDVDGDARQHETQEVTNTIIPSPINMGNYYPHSVSLKEGYSLDFIVDGPGSKYHK